MAAPLIVRDPAESSTDIQDVVVMFHDFTFRDPNEILASLKGGGTGVAHGAGRLCLGGAHLRQPIQDCPLDYRDQVEWAALLWPSR